MLERAEEIRRMKVQAEKGIKGSSHYSGGFGSSSMSSASSFSSSSVHHSEPTAIDSAPPSFSSSSGSKPNRAMKLGTSKDALPAFIEQQVKQSLSPSTQPTAASTSPLAPVPNQEKFIFEYEQKIILKNNLFLF